MFLLIVSSVLSDLNIEIQKLTSKVSNYVVIVNSDEGKATGTVIGKKEVVTVGIFSLGLNVDLIMKNNKKIKGKIIGFDEFSGITLVSTEDYEFTPPEISKKISPGNFCLVFGNSFGRLGPIGLGIVDISNNTYNIVIPMNPGNNGSGVFDIDGRLIGVIGGGFSTVKSNSEKGGSVFFFSGNIAYIIPYIVMENSIQKIRVSVTVKRGYLGISVDYVDKNFVIKEVAKNSPAANFGLKVGDKILMINGKKIRNIESLMEEIRTKESGTIVRLQIMRGFVKKEISVILGEKPSSKINENYIIKGYGE